ncbi:MAG: ATP-binding protein, partial [Acidobacteria bacterium]|nr:ATP-binding protein [Acidobacteriota bacterium]
MRAQVKASLTQASVMSQCKLLRLPSIAAQFARLAEEAVTQNQSHVNYLDALLVAEVEDRERKLIERRIKEAQLPRLKTIEEFDFAQAPQISARQIAELAEGGYVERSEPVIFIGEAGTGKTHLAA